MKRRAYAKLRAERRRKRLGVRLEDKGIIKSTYLRYYMAVRRILPVLETTKGNMDDQICEWIQERYADGDGVTSIADVLSGLHHFAPWAKGNLRGAWRLYRLWRRVEKPRQAPPLPESFTRALIGRCLELEDLATATALALGFWGFLRTGELLTVGCHQLLIGSKDMVVQLGLTKTGHRRQQDENVVITDPLTILLARTLLQIRKSQNRLGDPILSRGGTVFRETFRQHLHFFSFSQPFRPYSLRRGGATQDFRKYASMERTLVKGRWNTSQAARQYIQEGLSVLTTLQITPSQKSLVPTYAKKTSLSSN